MGLCVSETCLTVETRRTFRDILVKEKFVVVVVFSGKSLISLSKGTGLY